MRRGVGARVFGATLLAIVVFIIASGTYLEGELRAWLEGRIETELEHHAAAARVLVEQIPGDSVETIDPIADHLGRATRARITVIGGEGRLLGDSELDAQHLLAEENHGARPEVRGALASGRGTARRYSTTRNTDLLYVAVPSAGGRVVRAATPLADVAATVARLRRFLVLGGLLGFVLALGTVMLAARWATRDLRTVVAHALARTRGEQPSPLDLAPGDELSGIAGSLDRLGSDLNRALSALTEERDRFGAILASMHGGVVALDSAGRVTLANPAAAALLSWDDNPQGRPLVELTRVPGLIELVHNASMHGSASGEIGLGGPGGKRVQVSATALARGGLVFVLHDVTETRRLETVRRDFVANVSHELRTPLAVVRTSSEALLDGALDEPARARGFVEAIARHAERLSQLVADLLDLSRIEAGEYTMKRTAVSLASVVLRGMDSVASAARAKAIEIACDVDAGARVQADERALEQVLVNLLDNAVKYTQAGGHVRVAARPDGPRVRIEVRDDGPGIEARHRARVFERFYRVDAGRSRDLGGTGLGLSIVRHLVESMDGQVGVEAADPRGTVFWLTLPVAA